MFEKLVGCERSADGGLAKGFLASWERDGWRRFAVEGLMPNVSERNPFPHNRDLFERLKGNKSLMNVREERVSARPGGRVSMVVPVASPLRLLGRSSVGIW